MINRFYHTVRFFLHIFWDLAGSFRSGLHSRLARWRGEHSPLTIAWDAYPFYEQITGVGWYAYHLLESLSRRGDLRVNLYGKFFHYEEEEGGLRVDPGKLGGNVRFRHHGIPIDSLIPRRALLTFCRAVIAPLFFVLDGNDLLFAPNYYPPPFLRKASKHLAVTVHDLTYVRYPNLIQAETLDLLRHHMPYSLYSADLIYTVSDNTARDLRLEHPTSVDRTLVVLSGVDPPPVGGERVIEGPYLLFVSTIEPRKNLESLLRAFTLIKAGGYNGSLVIAGKVGWKSESVMTMMHTHSFASDIHHLDYVSREALGDLYRNADIFIFPSHYEGFGFPVLEAMAHGTPVVSASNSSLFQVGGDVAFFVDENDPGAIADAVRKILDDPAMRERTAQAGREWAARFPWEKAADETFEALEGHFARSR